MNHTQHISARMVCGNISSECQSKPNIKQECAFGDITGLYTNSPVGRYSVCPRTTNLFHVVELRSGAVIDLAVYVPPGGTKCGGEGRGDVGNC
jgi:hypothetical protein